MEEGMAQWAVQDLLPGAGGEGREQRFGPLPVAGGVRALQHSPLRSRLEESVAEWEVQDLLLGRGGEAREQRLRPLPVAGGVRALQHSLMRSRLEEILAERDVQALLLGPGGEPREDGVWASSRGGRRREGPPCHHRQALGANLSCSVLFRF